MSEDNTIEKAPKTRAYTASLAVKDGAALRFTGMMKRIGVAGNGGSFSEQAAIKYVEDRYAKEGASSGLARVEIVYLITAEGVLSALERGNLDVGIFATMNNHGGQVIENLPAMAEHAWSPEMDEEGKARTIVLPVKHMLMVRPDSSGTISAIVTQPQAYEQCKAKLAKLYPGIRIIPYEDTAIAAEHLADGTLSRLLGVKLEETAVVGPENAGQEHGLIVQVRNVQDHEDNQTTFAIATPLRGKDRESTPPIDK